MAALSITATNVVQSSGGIEVIVLNSGVTATRGDLLTKNSSGLGVLADKNDESLAGGGSVNAGIFLCLCDAGPGQKVVAAKTGSVITLGAVMTASTLYFVGDTGDIIPESDIAASDYVTQIGYSTSTSVLRFDVLITGQTK